jgi:hypothetical protein
MRAGAAGPDLALAATLLARENRDPISRLRHEFSRKESDQVGGRPLPS